MRMLVLEWLGEGCHVKEALERLTELDEAMHGEPHAYARRSGVAAGVAIY